ncbi:uncharacterized protein BYT42DRAFT_577356 [Radiomyces spectabilis]|uniref:uncharacterized protein n=1 Tax=Radiomyces spectabilis TaxID=64574 RepID=UPI00221EC414|nr:uncharacterized protein BYT42DRAFT_577356 [Radiomyces spectabilis]KAI8374709.1 hypothetical protein BYT42DRAFT_577356 [Radiomyces spectabilis]
MTVEDHVAHQGDGPTSSGVAVFFPFPIASQSLRTAKEWYSYPGRGVVAVGIHHPSLHLAIPATSSPSIVLRKTYSAPPTFGVSDRATTPPPGIRDPHPVTLPSSRSEHSLLDNGLSSSTDRLCSPKNEPTDLLPRRFDKSIAAEAPKAQCAEPPELPDAVPVLDDSDDAAGMVTEPLLCSPQTPDDQHDIAATAKFTNDTTCLHIATSSDVSPLTDIASRLTTVYESSEEKGITEEPIVTTDDVKQEEKNTNLPIQQENAQIPTDTLTPEEKEPEEPVTFSQPDAATSTDAVTPAPVIPQESNVVNTATPTDTVMPSPLISKEIKMDALLPQNQTASKDALMSMPTEQKKAVDFPQQEVRSVSIAAANSTDRVSDKVDSLREDGPGIVQQETTEQVSYKIECKRDPSSPNNADNAAAAAVAACDTTEKVKNEIELAGDATERVEDPGMHSFFTQRNGLSNSIFDPTTIGLPSEVKNRDRSQDYQDDQSRQMRSHDRITTARTPSSPSSSSPPKRPSRLPIRKSSSISLIPQTGVAKAEGSSPLTASPIPPSCSASATLPMKGSASAHGDTKGDGKIPLVRGKLAGHNAVRKTNASASGIPRMTGHGTTTKTTKTAKATKSTPVTSMSKPASAKPHGPLSQKVGMKPTETKHEEDEDEPPRKLSIKEKRARQAKRAEQLKFWRVREEREARQARSAARQRSIATASDPYKSETELPSSTSTSSSTSRRGVTFNLKRNRIIEIAHPVPNNPSSSNAAS